MRTLNLKFNSEHMYKSANMMNIIFSCAIKNRAYFEAIKLTLDKFGVRYKIEEELGFISVLPTPNTTIVVKVDNEAIMKITPDAQMLDLMDIMEEIRADLEREEKAHLEKQAQEEEQLTEELTDALYGLVASLSELYNTSEEKEDKEEKEEKKDEEKEIPKSQQEPCPVDHVIVGMEAHEIITHINQQVTNTLHIELNKQFKLTGDLKTAAINVYCDMHSKGLL